MTTPTATAKPTARKTGNPGADRAVTHLREMLTGDLDAHLIAQHGMDATTLPVSKGARAKRHADAHENGATHPTKPAEPVVSTAGTERVASAERKAAMAVVAKVAPKAVAKAAPKPAAAKAAPATPATLEQMAAEIARLQAELAAKAAPKPAASPAAKSARDYIREVDRALIVVAGQLVDKQVPAELRAEVAQAVANQLHHLANKTDGWPASTLPMPQRSDWR